ncbi:predicted integral membrane protein [Malacoplasma penetrans HF-2]|uniref:Predicted integral membrane protein n=1 Tax=Malacoplasma penetrans (strain HF-2) TaxID=272633 RepID=Q8EW84_MALP2|nr:M60 family metallopeptidase [Malacoplasma penetrans]BAC44112.1 predicted integral membrane protein [Malacoplasma penetrans HF-2]
MNKNIKLIKPNNKKLNPKKIKKIKPKNKNLRGGSFNKIKVNKHVRPNVGVIKVKKLFAYLISATSIGAIVSAVLVPLTITSFKSSLNGQTSDSGSTNGNNNSSNGENGFDNNQDNSSNGNQNNDSNNNQNPTPSEPVDPTPTRDYYDSMYYYDAKILDSYQRNVPEYYPQYLQNNGSNVAPTKEYVTKYYPNIWNSIITKDEIKNAITYSENDLMNAQLNLERTQNKTLKKHKISDVIYDTRNLYWGYSKISDSQPAVKKQLDLDLRKYGAYTTGLYLPAGEVITINFPGLTDEQVAALNIRLVINDNEIQDLTSSNVESQWSKCKNRMPVMRQVFTLRKNNFSFGNPLGGMINLEHINNTNTVVNGSNIFRVVIDGAVEALHYVHGYTTEDEWQRLVKESTAPFVEIENDYTKFLVPKSNLGQFANKENYEWELDENNNVISYSHKETLINNTYPYKSLDLWNKLSYESRYVSGLNETPTVRPQIKNYFTDYQYYVDGGAAYTSNAYNVMPRSWGSAVTNYDTNNNSGNWGVIHEYNHHFQVNPSNVSWGFIRNDQNEVTNNVLNLLAYAKYANIGQDRAGKQDISSWPSGHLSNINSYNAILKVIRNSTTSSIITAQTFHYTSVMANFGWEGLEKAIRLANTTSAPSNITDANTKFVYFISKATNYNWGQFYYQAGLISIQNLLLINEIFKDLEEYVPIASWYASQSKYRDSDTWVHSNSPFKITKQYFETGYQFDLKLNKTDKGSTLSDPMITVNPLYGTLVNNGNGLYTYKPLLTGTDTNGNPIYNYGEVDNFEYKVESINTATKKAISSTFKVEIFLEGDGNENFISKEEGMIDHNLYYRDNVTNILSMATSINSNIEAAAGDIKNITNTLENETVTFSNSTNVVEITIQLPKEQLVNRIVYRDKTAMATRADGLKIIDIDNNQTYEVSGFRNDSGYTTTNFETPIKLKNFKLVLIRNSSKELQKIAYFNLIYQGAVDF